MAVEVDVPKESLASLIAQLEQCALPERIAFRNPILAYGAVCIAPLVDAVERKPDLSASVASWLAMLAVSQPDVEDDAMRALRKLAHVPWGDIAQGILDRLQPKSTKATGAAPKAAPGPSAAEMAVYARVLQAAREHRTLTYSELETNRRHQGTYLHNISQAEHDLGHPPLTSIVVGKTNGRPGDGYLSAMVELGYAHIGEPVEDVWQRGIAAVFAFWADPEAEPGR